MANLMDFTKIAMSNLFSKPATYGYPFVKKNYPARYRGQVAIDIDDCIFCGMCMRKCPSGAIKVDRAAKSWAIERMGCVQCSNCVEGCPKKCLHMVPSYTDPSTEKTVDVVIKVEEEKPAEEAKDKE